MKRDVPRLSLRSQALNPFRNWLPEQEPFFGPDLPEPPGLGPIG
jgi:hypothetical protein